MKKLALLLCAAAFADASAKRIADISWFQIQEPENMTQEELVCAMVFYNGL